MPADKVEGKKWMDELVGAALDYLVKDSSKEIAFIMPGRKIEKGVPTMFEVRMKDKEIALKVRKGFSACMRDKAQMQADNRGRMFVANSVTLATRVRTDVLKAIAKRFSNNNEDLFVIGFTSRPVLTVKRKDTGSQYALTYVDAVAKFGESLSRGELQVAYGRAGNSFAGQLQQNFVVLHDKGEGKLHVGTGARPGNVYLKLSQNFKFQMQNTHNYDILYAPTYFNLLRLFRAMGFFGGGGELGGKREKIPSMWTLL